MLKSATLITGLQKQLSDLNLEDRNIENPGMSLLRVFFRLKTVFIKFYLNWTTIMESLSQAYRKWSRPLTMES